MIIVCYIIPVFIMFASTFKVLTGLSLAIVLARFLAWRGALRCQPQNPRNGDNSFAKIGVNLVSCSCGKWSPITLMIHKPLPPSTTSNLMLYSQARMVLYYILCIFAWSFCIKLVQHQLIVIMRLVSTEAIFW